MLDNNGDPMRYKYIPRIGEIIDRYGPSYGRYMSPIINGRPFNYDQRTLPFVEDKSQYHKYEVIGDISKLKEYAINCKDSNLRAEIEGAINYYYNGDYNEAVPYKGYIAGINGWGSGGGLQYEFPIKIELLVRLGILKEIF